MRLFNTMVWTTYFNPRSPRGERQLCEFTTIRTCGFQSTLPAGGATAFFQFPVNTPFQFQSTLPAGGATTDAPYRYVKIQISIHAPRGGSDFLVAFDAECDDVFQSTLPAGGATVDEDRAL